MHKPAQDLFNLRESIKKGDLSAINRAHDAGLLNNLMFDIVESLTFKTSSMLVRAASFHADFKQRDAQGNTLLHRLAQSQVQMLLVECELNVLIHCDYYQWAIEELVKQGLSIEDENNAKQTPMDIAVHSKNIGFCEGVKIFENDQARRIQEEKNQGTCVIT